MFQVEVNCPVYFLINTSLPDPYIAEASYCYASPDGGSDGSLTYELYDPPCEMDETFQILPSPSDNIVIFTFKMFEFAQTLFKKVGVYFQGMILVTV